MTHYFWVKEDESHYTLYTQAEEKVIELVKFFTNNKNQDCYGAHFIYNQEPWCDDFAQFYCNEGEGIEVAKKLAIAQMKSRCKFQISMYQNILNNLIEKENDYD